MSSSLVVRASDSGSQCRSRDYPVFDPSNLWHSGIWGATGKAVLNSWISYLCCSYGTVPTCPVPCQPLRTGAPTFVFSSSSSWKKNTRNFWKAISQCSRSVTYDGFFYGSFGSADPWCHSITGTDPDPTLFFSFLATTKDSAAFAIEEEEKRCGQRQ